MSRGAVDGVDQNHMIHAQRFGRTQETCCSGLEIADEHTGGLTLRLRFHVEDRTPAKELAGCCAPIYFITAQSVIKNSHRAVQPSYI